MSVSLEAMPSGRGRITGQKLYLCEEERSPIAVNLRSLDGVIPLGMSWETYSGGHVKSVSSRTEAAPPCGRWT